MKFQQIYNIINLYLKCHFSAREVNISSLGTTLNQFGSNGPPGYTSLRFVENVSYVLSFMIFSPGTAVGFCFSSDHDLCMPCVDKCMQDGSLNMEQCSFNCNCHWYGK